MHGDFSRRTFDAANGYRAVLLQQGRVLLDADVNEQAEITAHHDETRTRDLVGSSGGPAPGPNEPGPFAVVGPGSGANNGWSFSDTGWADLRITAGRYYVDGVLVEGDDAPPGGWALGDQPHLGVIRVEGEDDDPGLREPDKVGRYLAYLDVWQRQVTFDEDPALLEAALGGPDTTTRSQTVWQVRLAWLGNGELCRDLHAGEWRVRSPRCMVAELAEPPTAADPCQISLAGGYQRLENQLYRVQVHDAPDPEAEYDPPQEPEADPPPATFLWSRENGSVVARVTGLEEGEAEQTAVLTLDRVGRDEELSFRAGQLVELTSTDLELRGQSGFLADTGAPDGLELPVTWRGRGPTSLGALGRTPILRRWEGGPELLEDEATDLEGGIRVRFPVDGRPRTGDHWLVPARTVRLAYGLSQSSGTIEWPRNSHGAVAQPPVGPEHHLAPLAILVREADGEGPWSLEADCRRLFPPLTGPALSLVGGDGQEAMPGNDLPEPVRVAVRAGGRPIAGAPIRFTASDGGTVTPSAPPVETGPDGVAEVRWRLNSADSAAGVPAPSTQTLTIRLLDDGDPVDSPVVVTGRLSVARQVAWTPPGCERFRDSASVQAALEGIIRTGEIRLLGGDGQTVAAPGAVVPRPVRVVVDDGCGPVEGAAVTALANSHLRDEDDPVPESEFGLVKEAKAGDPTPSSLEGDGAPKVTVPTDENGVAAFWWQPSFGDRTWSTLDVVLDDAGGAPIRVTAGLVSRTPGVHITRLDFGDFKDVGNAEDERPFGNDQTVTAGDLVAGVVVTLDGPVVAASVEGKPVVRVLLDLPAFWPRAAWTHSVEVPGRLQVADDGKAVRWTLGSEAGAVLPEAVSGESEQPEGSPVQITGRFVVDGWAIVSADEPARHLNGHADAVVDETSGRTLLRLPTDDEVAGGQFVQWFRLVPTPEPVPVPVPKPEPGPGPGPASEAEHGPEPPVEVPAVIGQPQAAARGEFEALGLVPAVTREPSALPRGRVVRVDPAPGTAVSRGSTVTVVVSSRRIG